MLDYILNNLVTILVFVSMGVIFIIGIVQCITPLLAVRKALLRAEKRLDVRSDNGAYAYNEPDFLKCPYINDWWSRYIFNLREMQRSNADCDVLNFINYNTVIQSPSHNQFAELIPGMMTSLGVLGTFIGLVQGVSGLDVATSDITVLQGSIAALLGGMSSAFSTSIAGVVCAVVFQLVRRINMSRATDALNLFVQTCQNVVSKPYTQDTKLIQAIYSLMIEVRKSNEKVQQALLDKRD